MIETAIGIATEEAFNSGLNYKHGCVAMNRYGEVIAKGFNSCSLLPFRKELIW